jgi:hypothetical protein
MHALVSIGVDGHRSSFLADTLLTANLGASETGKLAVR